MDGFRSTPLHSAPLRWYALWLYNLKSFIRCLLAGLISSTSSLQDEKKKKKKTGCRPTTANLHTHIHHASALHCTALYSQACCTAVANPHCNLSKRANCMHRRRVTHPPRESREVAPSRSREVRSVVDPPGPDLNLIVASLRVVRVSWPVVGGGDGGEIRQEEMMGTSSRRGRK